MDEHNDKLYCPYCGSSQLTANKKGFGAGKALTGAVLTGGIGLLAGFIGSGKVKITCLKCGRTMKPGELSTTPLTVEQIKKRSDDELHDQLGCLAAFAVYFVVVMLIMYIVTMCQSKI